MFSAVKRTLCELVLAAGALGMAGCTAISTTAPKEYAEESVDKVVQHAVDYFNNREYRAVIDLMTKRSNYLNSENRKVAEQLRNAGIYALPPEQKLKPRDYALFALSYAMDGDYPNARTQFTSLMDVFKNNPVETVQDIEKLQTFFEGDPYKKAEKMAIGGIIFDQEMNAVVGFLKFAHKDYENARKYFKAAIPHFKEEKVRDYRTAFKILLIDAAEKEADDNTIIEYAKTVKAVCSVKGIEESTNN